MIAIASESYNPIGDFVINELDSSDLADITRRINKTKTLDGGVVVEDLGYAEKDRDFNIKVKATHELKEFFINALSLYPDMTLATDHGCFSVVLKDCKLNKDTFQIKLISK